MKKSVWIGPLIILLLFVLCGCATKPVPENQTSLSTHNPDQLIGKWELIGANGYYENYQFTPDHQVIIENRTLGKWVKAVYTYEDVSGLLVFSDGQRFDDDQLTGPLDNIGMISYGIDNGVLFIFNNTYTEVSSFSQTYGS